MTSKQPWMVCVRVNRHDKAYFLHQRDGFTKQMQLVVWEDHRPDAERASDCAVVVGTPWAARLAIPGGHRLMQLWQRLRAALVSAPLAASSREIARFETLSPPSVIYAHTGAVGLRMLPLKKRFNVPLVVHFHGLDITNPDPIYRRELQRNIRDFDRIIVVGQWMIDPLVKLGYEVDRISVIPMGALTRDVPPAQRQDDGVVRFVSVGRMVPCKGLDRTLAAFAKLRETLPTAELHLIGDGPERAGLEAQAGAGVIFHGQQPSEAALALVGQSDVMVHHALDHPGGPEAFGVVITEAMARGLPVVGTYCGGLPDQIVDGQTGLLVQQSDVDAMAEAMIRLAKDADLRAQMGKAGRARAQAEFDAHDLARRAETIVRDA